MKYENQDFCPGYITVMVVDDRIWDDYFWWWVPFPPSDYLIHHFNHISPLPKMMTKLIIVTSANFHKLALAYLILSDFCFFPPKMHFFFQSIELPSCHPNPPLVCLCLLHSPGNSLHWACPFVQWKKFRSKGQANKCAPSPALFLKSYVTSSISFDRSEPVPSAAKWERGAWWRHLSEVFTMYPPNKCACMCTHTSCLWKTSVSYFYDWYLT